MCSGVPEAWGFWSTWDIQLCDLSGQAFRPGVNSADGLGVSSTEAGQQVTARTMDGTHPTTRQLQTKSLGHSSRCLAAWLLVGKATIALQTFCSNATTCFGPSYYRHVGAARLSIAYVPHSNLRPTLQQPQTSRIPTLNPPNDDPASTRQQPSTYGIATQRASIESLTVFAGPVNQMVFGGGAGIYFMTRPSTYRITTPAKAWQKPPGLVTL